MKKQIAEIHSADTLSRLEKYLAKQESDKLRRALLNEYDRLFAYTNIKEWNELVGLQNSCSG